MKFRHLLSWKGLFYDVLLPALRLLGPARGDAVLGLIGRLALLWPPRRRALTAALERGRAAQGADWDTQSLLPDLAANAARFLARDYPLDAQADDKVLARFDVQGHESLEEALAQGRGAVLVGSHLGAHVAGLHWLYRRGVPLRLLVQRPGHVSGELNRRFDAGDGAHPQAGFFLRRDLPAGQCVERLVRARAALRAGMAVYLNGDIPWPGPNTRPGRLLGQPRRFLSVWTDLAALTGAPVFLVFCTYRPRGRYALTVEPLGPLTAAEAVARYLSRLESAIAAEPAAAVAHLLWPCYGPPAPSSSPTLRPSRRSAPLIETQIA